MIFCYDLWTKLVHCNNFLIKIFYTNMKTNWFYIADRFISEDAVPLVIAEIGINHGWSLKVAKEMVDAAYLAGVIRQVLNKYKVLLKKCLWDLLNDYLPFIQASLNEVKKY